MKEECKKHNFVCATPDDPVKSEVRDYGTDKAKWDDYLLLFCSYCGHTKKVFIREMKPE